MKIMQVILHSNIYVYPLYNRVPFLLREVCGSVTQQNNNMARCRLLLTKHLRRTCAYRTVHMQSSFREPHCTCVLAGFTYAPFPAFVFFSLRALY